MTSQGKITKSDLRKVFWRNLFGLQLGWNYEKMQGLGYCYVVMPVLRKLYPQKEELAKAMQTHLSFFNTTPATSNLIVGANVAIEEEFGQTDPQTITALKTGLMGPFAGIGDSIFIALYRAIVFSIAAYFAQAENPAGLLIPLICGSGIMWVRYHFTFIGYQQGKKVATEFASSLKMLTEAASILGVTVIGGLVASVVKAQLALEFTVGKVTVSMQSFLDKIMPNLLPLTVVLFSYWLLGKKKMNSTRLIFVLILLGILLGNLNSITSMIASLIKTPSTL